MQRTDNHPADASIRAVDPALEPELAYWRAELTPGRRERSGEVMLGYQTTRRLELEAALGERAQELPAMRVLEIGCGPIPAIGVGAWRERVACDPLIDRYETEGLWTDPSGRVERVRGSGEALPFARGRFDAVVCENCLDHTRDPDRVIREIARVLPRSGLLWLLVDEMDFSDELHTGLRGKAVRGLCERAGFVVLSEQRKASASHPEASGQTRWLMEKTGPF